VGKSTGTDLAIDVRQGGAIETVLADLARLRIAVFREFPYLYEGDLEYEAHYLRNYAASQEGLVVVVRDGGRVVGASTAMPLSQHSDEVAPPLERAGYPASEVYYLGESILLPAYRGRGVGHRFFDEREAAARRFGYRYTSFCAVNRPSDHPQCPKDYVPHDAFWTKRGYQKRPDIVTEFGWLDLGEREETKKPMIFWIKDLGSHRPRHG
jgi:GNAT superfamily N-acetyltransferase